MSPILCLPCFAVADGHQTLIFSLSPCGPASPSYAPHRQLPSLHHLPTTKAARACRFKPLQEAFGGVVFDSSPCYMHVMVGARAVAEGQPWVAAAVAQAAFILGALLLVLFKPLIGFWPSRFW